MRALIVYPKGGRLLVSAEDAKENALVTREIIEQYTTGLDPNKRRKFEEVRVVSDSEFVECPDHLQWVSSCEFMCGGVIIFNSATVGLVEQAKKTAKENQRIRVVIFTGLIPDGEVVFVSKGGISSIEALMNAC